MSQGALKTGATWCLLAFFVSSIQTNGGSDDTQFFGHDVKLRPAFMSRDGRHSFVDTNVTLTSGTLKAFRFYVHNLADDTPLSDVTAQIWRPIAGEDEALRLVWEKELQIVERNHEQVVQLEEHEQFQVKRTDKIGFQCESNTCPITMDIAPQGRTYIRRAQRHILGKAMYDFKGPVATVFSIGVDILPANTPSSEEDEDQSEISFSAEELLSPDALDMTTSSSNWNLQTSGISEEELAVSSEDEYTDDNDDDDAFGEPYYTPEQRREMLGRSVYHGHNLTLGDEFWEKEGRMSFVDTTLKLQNGVLKAISLFIHDAPLQLDDVDIYLELWSRSDPDTTNFKLEWQKLVRLTHGPNRLYEFIFDPRDQVPVTEDHLLGFSNMDHTCPISFKYAENGRTLFKTIRRYEGPSYVNEVYRFAEIHEPIFFSMGAYVSPTQVTTDVADNTEENEVRMPDLVRQGHSLIQRQYFLPNLPVPKVIVDKSVHLTPGYIRKIAVFIGRVTARELAAPIRFQVWSYNGTAGEGAETHPVYRLKWQQSFTLSSLTVATQGNRREVFAVNDRVLVNRGDRIGFVSEARTIQIPYDFNNAIGQASEIDFVDLLTLNRTDDGTIEYPAVREEVYHFDAHPHPITWSIEVEIEPIAVTPGR